MKFSRNTASIAAASLALITLATLGGWTQAANWAQWRGQDRDGISAEKGLLKRWPAEGPKRAGQAMPISVTLSHQPAARSLNVG